MNVSCEFLGLDMAGLGYLAGIPTETVEKKNGLGSIADNEILIELINRKNAFTKEKSLLSGMSIEGEPVVVTDDFGRYIDARVSYGRAEKENFVLHCRSVLSPLFNGLVSIEEQFVTPARALMNLYDLYGIPYDASSFGMADAYYQVLGVQCHVLVDIKDNITVKQVTDGISEMAVLDIWPFRGKMHCRIPLLYEGGSLRTITDTIAGYPESSWNDSYFTSYAIDYSGSGGVPLEGGSPKKDRCWNVSYNLGSNIQIADFISAFMVGTMKLARDGRPKRQLKFLEEMGKLDIDFQDVYLVTLTNLNLQALPMQIMRYERAGKMAVLELEEI